MFSLQTDYIASVEALVIEAEVEAVVLESVAEFELAVAVVDDLRRGSLGCLKIDLKLLLY